jgi:hypothetical protein
MHRQFAATFVGRGHDGQSVIKGEDAEQEHIIGIDIVRAFAKD